MLKNLLGTFALISLSLPIEVSAQTSVWDGVFSEEQALRGATVYSGSCVRCHGPTGNGANDPEMPKSPSIARATFITRWQDRPLAALFALVKDTMPEDNPTSLTDQQYIDAIAYMLTLSTMPAGPSELPADPQRLAEILIGPEPAP
jgi:cytochrome c